MCKPQSDWVRFLSTIHVRPTETHRRKAAAKRHIRDEGLPSTWHQRSCQTLKVHSKTDSLTTKWNLGRIPYSADGSCCHRWDAHLVQQEKCMSVVRADGMPILLDKQTHAILQIHASKFQFSGLSRKHQKKVLYQYLTSKTPPNERSTCLCLV